MCSEHIEGDEWGTYVALNVQHHRNVGWPTGREPQGHGVLVVVWGGESPLHGEGGQVDDMGKGEGCEMHTNLNLSICRQLES